MKRALALLTLLTLPAQAKAAQASPLPAPATAAKKPAHRRVLRLDEVTVEGRIQKPQAFFILQRSQLNFEQLEKKESFLLKIIKSTEKDPF